MREDNENTKEAGGFNFDFKADFDFSFDIGLSNAVDTRYMKARKAKPIPNERIKYSNAKKLAKKIKIEDDVRWDIIVPGNFVFGDLIEAIIMENNAKVTEMTVSTLSLDQNNEKTELQKFRLFFTSGFCIKKALIFDDFSEHQKHQKQPFLVFFSTNTKFLQIFYKR